MASYIFNADAILNCNLKPCESYTKRGQLITFGEKPQELSMDGTSK